MRKEDLMIGDWVDIRFQDDGENEHLYSQVEQLWEYEIDADFETSYDNVYPIPLTEEILKENGFHLWPGYSNVWTANTGGTRFCISNEYKIGHDDIGLFIMVTYVHELQHTLKLLNDNREIKLPEFKDLIEKYKSIENDDEWWESCPHCAFFDGYDMCLVHNNFGAVTDVSKARCESEKLFKEK